MLFSAEMVRAILSGQKTQTRRLVEAKPFRRHGMLVEPTVSWACDAHVQADAFTKDSWLVAAYAIHDHQEHESIEGDIEWTEILPKWSPGDLIWPRENIRYTPSLTVGGLRSAYVRYEATKDAADRYVIWEKGEVLPAALDREPRVLVPGIFMPKKVCRIWLRVLSVRPERLQDITWQDVWAEGVGWDPDGEYPEDQWSGTDPAEASRQAFFELWDSLYGKKAPVDSNPWVWRIGYEREER